MLAVDSAADEASIGSNDEEDSNDDNIEDQKDADSLVLITREVVDAANLDEYQIAQLDRPSSILTTAQTDNDMNEKSTDSRDSNYNGHIYRRAVRLPPEKAHVDSIALKLVPTRLVVPMNAGGDDAVHTGLSTDKIT